MGNGAATNVSTRAHPRLYLQPAFSPLSPVARPSWILPPPSSEVEQVKGISAERAQRELADALSV
jgi:hypothetical protein